jgi:hypothetical protein
MSLKSERKRLKKLAHQTRKESVTTIELERKSIKDFYGEVTPKILELDNGGKFRGQVMNLRALLDPEAARRKDAEELADILNGRMSPLKAQPLKKRVDLTLFCLKTAGYWIEDGQVYHDGRILTKEDITRFNSVVMSDPFWDILHKIPLPVTQKDGGYNSLNERQKRGLEISGIRYLNTWLNDVGLSLVSHGDADISYLPSTQMIELNHYLAKLDKKTYSRTPYFSTIKKDEDEEYMMSMGYIL